MKRAIYERAMNCDIFVKGLNHLENVFIPLSDNQRHVVVKHVVIADAMTMIYLKRIVCQMNHRWITLRGK